MTLPSASPLRRLGGGVLCLAAFLVGFGALSKLLGRITPLPPMMAVSKKIRFFEESHQECEVVFVGSSRVQHQVDCQQFDAALAAAGRPVHSYNFGQDGTWPPESLYLARDLLKRPMPKLKWIFIELMNVDGRLHGNGDDTAQILYWHDRHHTNLAESELFRTKSFREALPYLVRHELLWLKKASGYGAGTRLIRKALFADRDPRPDEFITNRAGYNPAHDVSLAGADRTLFLKILEKDRDELVRQETPLPPALRNDLHELITAWRRRGVEPVFLIPPGHFPSESFADVPDGAPLLCLSRPDLYPELFLPENYRDQSHLNPKGAALFTALLAQKFLELVPDQP